MPLDHRSGRGIAEFVNLLAALFRRAGWRVVRQPRSESAGIRLIVDSGDRKFLVELKRSAESRPDRLIPLMSQAILEAKAASQQFSELTVPVAVVVAPRIQRAVAEQAKQFAK